MKKLVLLILLLSCYQLSLLANQASFSDTFSQLNKQEYNDLVGHDLDLKVWKDTRENVTPGLPSLFVHGFGASPTTMVEWTMVAGPDKIPGDVVTFRFFDATDTNTPDFSHFNLGQKRYAFCACCIQSNERCYRKFWMEYAWSITWCYSG